MTVGCACNLLHPSVYSIKPTEFTFLNRYHWCLTLSPMWFFPFPSRYGQTSHTSHRKRKPGTIACRYSPTLDPQQRQTSLSHHPLQTNRMWRCCKSPVRKTVGLGNNPCLPVRAGQTECLRKNWPCWRIPPPQAAPSTYVENEVYPLGCLGTTQCTSLLYITLTLNLMLKSER